MVEHLLSIKTNELNNIVDGNNRLSKSVSFNTDEDDSVQLGDSQHISDAESAATKSDIAPSAVDKFKRSIFAVHSPSIDSLNDAEALSPDTPLSEKIKKKKQRRITQQSSVDSGRKIVVRSPPWYTKVDFVKPISYVLLVIILYIMWKQRAVWIPRLLTSNHRIRHIALANEQKLQEKGYSPQTSASDNSNSTASGQNDDNNDDDDGDDNNNNKDQTTVSNSDEPSTPTPSKYTSPQKLNIRVRRNKMSFSKERTDKKRRHVQQSVVDDDDDDDDTVDDSGAIDTDSDEIINDEATPDLPSQIHSSKHHHHHHEQQPKVYRSREKKRKIVPSTRTSLATLSQDDIVEQLQNLISSRDRNRDLLSVMAKETGLKKEKIKQFIQKRDFRAVSLDNLISIVKSYDSTLLIIPN
ncbi:unnamed protein product [Adineta ricciae]|uniref:Uncharacterized protein n=1 Tax=Adineta ricciae TaxID=249248 RepID=A0A814Q8K1_ADIRI|nr:unnamed protein product [Adineta ricciae]CAF1234230.1 unnamed protein product [Adineta ricciae]